MQTPFFVFGCPRSGTSLLTRMLDRHPNLAIPYESHLYNQVYPSVRGYRGLDRPERRRRLVAQILRTEHLKKWIPPPSLTDTLAAITRSDFHGVVEGLMNGWTSGVGKSRWGEKTPQHTLYWRTVLEGFPASKIVHLTRDGRDVALSYRAAPFGPKHVYHLALRWVQYLRAAEAAQAALGERAFLLVRYESLLENPEGELKRVCAFLDEEFTPEMLDFYSGAAAYPTDQRNEDNLRRPLLTDNTEKWRTEMSARELRIFESIAGAELERYGYTRAVPNARISRWEALSCRFVEHPPRRALAMLRNVQGRRLALQTLRLRLHARLGL
ncbi:MAG: sulfotransferase [Gemmatimonadales bacterium]|nr:sulfotransferase [Gemmatimonadales bacterium]